MTRFSVVKRSYVLDDTAFETIETVETEAEANRKADELNAAIAAVTYVHKENEFARPDYVVAINKGVPIEEPVSERKRAKSKT